MHVGTKVLRLRADHERRTAGSRVAGPMAEDHLMSTTNGASAELYRTTGELVSPLTAVHPSAVRKTSVDPARPDLFLRLRSIISGKLEAFKHSQKLRRFKKSLKSSPDNPQLLNTYSNYLEFKGMGAEAAGVYGHLFTIYRRLREADKAAVYCRKLDTAGNRDAARCYRELAHLHSELGRYEDAAYCVKRVVELYLEEGQAKAAEGFIRQLPPLGMRAEATREELTRMTSEHRHQVAAPSRSSLHLVPDEQSAAQASRPAATYTTNPLAAPVVQADDDVFLSGHLGRITAFDVVQIVESNSLTGRLDFVTPPEFGSIYFRDGHIVAASQGVLSGHDALRAIFTADPSPFRVVVTETVPDEEFRVSNNTGLLLDIIREIDEAAEQESGAVPASGPNELWS